MLHREWHHQKWWSREAQDCSTEATIKLAETVRVNFWNCNLMKKASMGSTLWRKSPLNSGKMILVSARSACEDSGPLFGAAWWCQRGAVQTLYSQNCGCVCGPVWQFPDGLIQRFAFALPPLNSWALKTWPTTRCPGKEDTWGKGFEGLERPGYLEGHAHAQNRSLRKDLEASTFEWFLGGTCAGGEGWAALEEPWLGSGIPHRRVCQAVRMSCFCDLRHLREFSTLYSLLFFLFLNIHH